MKNGIQSQKMNMSLGGETMHEVKIALLGKISSGKTSLATKFISNVFNTEGQYRSTIGVAYVSRKVEYDNKRFCLQIWDTAGCERFESLSRSYYRGAKAAVICHDLLDLQSYERAVKWADELVLQEPECTIYLCGTKKDLVTCNMSRVMNFKKVLNYANFINAKVIETSSKTGEGVRELFLQIIKDYAARANLLSQSDIEGLQLCHQPKEKFQCICKSL